MFSKVRLGWATISAVGCAIAMAGIGGCSSSEPQQSSSATAVEYVSLGKLNADQRVQKELAIQAKDKLFKSLSGELMKSMGEKGPAKSIAVCKTRAPEIAKSVAAETGVRIGRTSFKLRNDANQPPEWATQFVSKQVDKPIDVALADDALGVLLPIRLQATCTLCHGTKEQVMPEVKAAIVSNYPNDNATGFSEGDVRGYFWVEVPAEVMGEK